MDTSILEDAEMKLATLAPVLDSRLAGRRYLLGDDISVADISVASYLVYARPAGIPLGAYPYLIRWHEAIERLPAWQQHLPRQ
ncbi:MAG TPA: glutathione S-transferase C-terminal domain-containing protein [Allosphingosinicella sp.]|uniref:glutathione S-transferase family protein n=1 Tax=Allosphingosinicella sp. TaxID=2823234 RepID=UPI002ED9D1F3